LKSKILKRFASWLDVFLLLPGMALIAKGVFLIYQPAGYIMAGILLVTLAFFVAKKQTDGGGS